MLTIEIKVKDIIRECEGKLVIGNEETLCENFSKDTREIKSGEVYIGIKGEKFDGNLFYEQALEQGAKVCIIQNVDVKQEIINKYKDRCIIQVEDTVKCIQKLASYKRSLYDIPVIAITGSVGKTSTKDIVASVLSKKFDVLKTQANYNNEIGLPLTILRLKNHTAMVLEMGMNSFGEISLLTNIARPTTCIITNIGTAHIGKLGSRENILKAKLEILEGLKENGNIILNNDNDLLHDWYIKNQKQYSCMTYGIYNNSSIMATKIDLKEDSSSYELHYNKDIYNIVVHVAGEHFVYNSLCAICVGLSYHIPIDKIKEGIGNFNLTKKRMDIIKKNNEITVINDSYNASYESMKMALECLSNMTGKRKIAVLGDMFELGKYSDELHKKVGIEVVNNKIDILITVGKLSKQIANQAIEGGMEKSNIYILENTNEAIEKLNSLLKPKDIVLVKASNGMNFDKIVRNII